MALNIPKNYANGQILFKAQLDAAFASIETFLNDTKINNENIQTGGVSADNLASSSVTTAKIAAAAVTLAKLATDVTDRLTPTGTILAYGGTSAPSGFLLCDGSQVSRTVYAALFNVIGENFGQGDNTSTFHLPDFRGRFLRGRDGGAGRDPDASSRTAMNTGGNTGDAVGSIQNQGVAPLKISITSGDGNTSTPVTTGNSFSTTAGGQQLHSTGTGSLSTSTNYIQSTVDDTESRPINANVNYIIKI